MSASSMTALDRGSKMAEMVRFVRAHAAGHLDAGWDIVTEAWGTEELARVIGRNRSLTGAVNTVRAAVVAPYVCKLLETRVGEDDDPQLDTARALCEETAANYNDATVTGARRLTPRAVSRELGFYVEPRVAPAPVFVEVDLSKQDGDGPAPRIVPDEAPAPTALAAASVAALAEAEVPAAPAQPAKRARRARQPKAQ